MFQKFYADFKSLTTNMLVAQKSLLLDLCTEDITSLGVI